MGKIVQEVLVPGGFGRSFSARRGQLITVIDLEGKQAGDFVAFKADDLREALSPPHTREALASLYIKVGNRLLTNRRRPILEVVEDTVGIHDATIPACDPTRYEVDFGVPDHRNCLENLHEALTEYRLDILHIPEPFNLFQNTPVVADGRIGITDPLTKPRDRIVFRALLDIVGALSPCPQDIIPGNGLAVTDLKVVISEA